MRLITNLCLFGDIRDSRGLIYYLQLYQFFTANQCEIFLDFVIPHIFLNHSLVFCPIVEFSQIKNDAWEWVIFFLHFLVVTSALFRLSWSDKDSHGLEDFVKSSHLLADEMFVIDLQEPMISLVLFQWPMTFSSILFI